MTRGTVEKRTTDTTKAIQAMTQKQRDAILARIVTHKPRPA